MCDIESVIIAIRKIVPDKSFFFLFIMADLNASLYRWIYQLNRVTLTFFLIYILLISAYTLPTSIQNHSFCYAVQVWSYTVVQSHKAVSAYFTNTQILPFGFARQYILAHSVVSNWDYVAKRPATKPARNFCWRFDLKLCFSVPGHFDKRVTCSMTV